MTEQIDVRPTYEGAGHLAFGVIPSEEPHGVRTMDHPVEWPHAELRNGVMHIHIDLHGDTGPRDAFLEVYATSEERAREQWKHTASKVDLKGLWG